MLSIYQSWRVCTSIGYSLFRTILRLGSAPSVADSLVSSLTAVAALLRCSGGCIIATECELQATILRSARKTSRTHRFIYNFQCSVSLFKQTAAPHGSQIYRLPILKCNMMTLPTSSHATLYSSFWRSDCVSYDLSWLDIQRTCLPNHSQYSC